MPRPDGSAGDADVRVRGDVAAFLGSPHAAPFLGERAAAADVAREFLAACYGALGVSPHLLDEEQLREALLDVLPSRLDPGSPAVDSAAAIVRALLDHHFETRPNAHAWKLAAVLDEAERELPSRIRAQGGRDVAPAQTITRPGSKLGRNDPCPCGSGRKFKKCCGRGE